MRAGERPRRRRAGEGGGVAVRWRGPDPQCLGTRRQGHGDDRQAAGRDPVSRLQECFARAKAGKRAALVIYLTGQDPDDETSRRLMHAAAEAGADIIELGVPWSDPSADGPARRIPG